MEFRFKPPAAFTRKEGVLKALEPWDIWGLQDFSGYIDYNQAVILPPFDGTILLDLGTVLHMAQLWVNGREVGKRLWPPYCFDITDFVKNGSNNIHLRVGNLIGNSYGQPKEAGLLGPVVISKVKQYDNR